MEAEVHEHVEFVEDSSLGLQCSDPHYADLGALAAPLALYGCGNGDYYRPGLEGEGTSVVEYSDGDRVEYEAIPVSADYTATVLTASSLEALTLWMDENEFAHDEIDDAAFRRYVGEGRWFVAIEVTPEDLGGEERALAPLVVTYLGHEFPITHELSYDPDGGVVETDLFVMAPTRVHVADGDARVVYAAPFALDPFRDVELDSFGSGDGWLTRLHLERRMSDALQMDSELVPDPLSVEEVHPVIERTTRVRVAQGCCGSNSIPDSDAPARTFIEERIYMESDAPDDSSFFYAVPPQDPDYCPGGTMYDEPGYGYACTLTGAAASWSPVLMAIFLTVRRKRRARA